MLAAHILLAFGAMGARKNITNIVAAYRQARFSGDTVLLIAGKVRNDYRQEFDAAVASFSGTPTPPNGSSYWTSSSRLPALIAS